MDPVVAVWVGLALNVGGVFMMLGAKRQQISDLVKRMDRVETDCDLLDHDKLSVQDYHREQEQLSARIGELDTRHVRDLARVENRLDALGSGRGR